MGSHVAMLPPARHGLWFVFTLLPAFAAAPQPSNWVTLLQDDFEGSASSWQLGWTESTSASWRRVKDAGNTVYSGQGHAWLNLPSRGWSDFRFRSRVKLVQGGVHINYRLNGCGRYFVPFHSSGLQLARTPLDCTAGGIVKSTSEIYPLGSWHEVEIVGVGASIKVYLGGVLKLDYTDPDPMSWGGIAFECLADSQVLVDDVEISGPPQPVFPAWIKVGGPIGGLGYDVRMGPDNPDIMFVTDTFSGVNISVDGGRRWHTSNQGVTTQTGTSGNAVPVFSLTIDPHNPDVIWIGTQDTRGIFRSADGGKTWVEKTNGVVERSGISFRGITIDPKDSNTVYAAAEISSYAWAGKNSPGKEFDRTKGVVYRTRDGGQNWTAIWRGDNLARYVWIDPRDSAVIYVSTGIFDREAANSDLVHGEAGGVGILKTTDGGQTWRVLNQSHGLGNLYVGSLFLHPQNPDILLAGTGMNQHLAEAGIYLSTDQGAHWRRGVGATSGALIQDIIGSVEFAVSDSRIAYAGSASAFYRSEDGGVTWAIRSGGPPNHYYGPPGIRCGVPIDLQVDPRDPDRVFINNYGGGNFLSEDGGKTWRVASQGYTGAQLHRIALDPRDDGNLYVIGRSGPFRSVDRGSHWIGLLNGPAVFAEWYSVALDPGEVSTVLISDEHQGNLLRSTDRGRNWQRVFRHPQVTGAIDSRHGFKALVFAPSNPRTVYAGMCTERNRIEAGTAGGSFGVFKSLDGGITWQDTNDASMSGQNINVLAVHPRHESIVYAGTLKSGVLVSMDGGQSWRGINQGLSTLDVRSLAIDPVNPSVVYAGLEGGGLYKSTDAGATWKVASTGMDSTASVRDIVIDPVNPQTVYAGGTRTGVHCSKDGGKLWLAVDRNLSMRAVKALAISSDGGTLYAATEGEGVFRLDLTSAGTGVARVTSAASYLEDAGVAPDSIASVFGAGFADHTETAPSSSLPATVGGISLSLTDSAGVELNPSLFLVSPGQINFLVPPALGEGEGVIRVFKQGRLLARGDLRIEPVSPALFTANADGKGVPAAVALRIAADGVQTWEYVFRCGACAGSCAASPIDLGAETDQVILLLFGTGIRGRASLANTTVQIGGIEALVTGVGAQGQFAGLDQVNVRLPRTLAGRGEAEVVLTVAGRRANTVRIHVR